MFNKASAVIAFLFLAGATTAGTLEGCNLLSREDLAQLQVPNGAAASPEWSEKDRTHLCKYKLGEAFNLLVAFGKPPEESIQRVRATMQRAKSTAPTERRPGTDGAFNDSGFCITVEAPETQVVTCNGIRGETLLTVLIMRSTSIGAMKVPASSLLHTFDEIFSKLTL
jgi:hypothetical protein